MNRVEFNQAGGFPLETNTLDFLQAGLGVLQALTSLGGDNYILSGCIVAGANVSDGYVVINGEVLPFQGGGLQTKVVVREDVSNKEFENGSVKGTFFTRYATFGTGDPFTLFSDLVRIKDLKTFRNLPHEASNAIDSNSETTLATSKAVKDVYDALKNQLPIGAIIVWSGSIPNIPFGFALCDGQQGRPDLRDKFVLGAGNTYAVGAIGGEKEHILTIAEMPAHHHTLSGAHIGQEYSADRGSSRNSKDATNPNTTDTGGGLPHNNMPPYFALAYIIKI